MVCVAYPTRLGTFTYNPRFPGQVYDAETGLHYNYHRYYDPKTGTYIQSDPIGLMGGVNTYAYVSNNPLRYIDPLGLSGQSAPTYYVPGLPYAYGSPENYALSKALTKLFNSSHDDSDENDESLPNCPPKRVTNPKHHRNSNSPEPENVDDLFDKSIADREGRRWVQDEDGVIHRFSKPSNGETHWNGSTTGDNPIRTENIPVEIRRQLR